MLISLSENRTSVMSPKLGTPYLNFERIALLPYCLIEEGEERRIAVRRSIRPPSRQSFPSLFQDSSIPSLSAVVLMDVLSLPKNGYRFRSWHDIQHQLVVGDVHRNNHSARVVLCGCCRHRRSDHQDTGQGAVKAF